MATLLLVGAASDASAQQAACYEARDCTEAGTTKSAVVVPDEKLERCESYKRQAEGFPALRTSFEALSVSAAQCTGQLDLLAVQYDAERVRADALRAELDARWPWYVWLGVGAALVVAGEVVLFLALR